jgi:hypothetical protein
MVRTLDAAIIAIDIHCCLPTVVIGKDFWG